MPQAVNNPRCRESICHLFIMNRLTANKCHPVARYDIASTVGQTKDVLGALFGLQFFMFRFQFWI